MKYQIKTCKSFRIHFILYALLLTVYSSYFTLYAELLKTPGTAGVAFLKIGFSARPAALAGSFTAFSDDVTSLEYNISGIAAIKSIQYALTHVVWFEDITANSFLMSIPVGAANVLGLNASILQAKDFVRQLKTPADETQPAKITESDEIKLTDLAVSVCYAHRFLFIDEEPISELKLGLAPKYITEKLYNKEHSAFAMDAGLTLLPAGSRTSYGISVQNIGNRIRQDDILPMTVRAGIAQHTDGFNYGLDISQSIDSKTKVSIGLELIIERVFALRIGAFYQQAFNWTAGLGFDFNAIKIDYAYLPHADLGSTHR
ncbi:MAG: PorV/PorQ family protein, partial [Elusimicrobiota bacterium]|nr:PorV/PorQ family protein [Elusimicrobiota bacterium]